MSPLDYGHEMRACPAYLEKATFGGIAWLCMEYVTRALAAVDAAIEEHRQGNPSAPFSERLLLSVRDDLSRMAASSEYSPTYPRFVLDWPDSSSPLGELLMEASALRYRALRRGR